MMFLLAITLTLVKADDLFYDETYHLKKLAMNKYKKPNRQSFNNFQDFLRIENRTKYNITIADKGDRNILLDMSFMFETNNFKLLSENLNQKNYIYNLPNDNLLFISYCTNFINCKVKIVFVNKIDFSFYEFTQIGELFPELVGFSFDFYRNVYLVVK
jgi:hypothetical protein